MVKIFCAATLPECARAIAACSDAEDHIRAAEVIDATALREAIEKGLARLRQSRLEAIEISEGAIKVFPVSAPLLPLPIAAEFQIESLPARDGGVIKKTPAVATGRLPLTKHKPSRGHIPSARPAGRVLCAKIPTQVPRCLAWRGDSLV
jgi:hypothetical protein